MKSKILSINVPIDASNVEYDFIDEPSTSAYYPAPWHPPAPAGGGSTEQSFDDYVTTIMRRGEEETLHILNITKRILACTLRSLNKSFEVRESRS
jgi:hypothetical protein